MKPLGVLIFPDEGDKMGTIVPFKLFETNEASPGSAQLKNEAAEFWFASNKIKKIARMALEAAQQDVNVLITGDTGVGKTLFAKFIKENSSRADKPLIIAPVCSIPEELIASELFGHKKGAFTGAIRDHSGYFRDADGGTIFLDEIGDLPLKHQVQLLNAVQEKIISPVGGRNIKVDVRIISATNKNLKELVASGLFREDLYYRLAVLDLRIPPLRERPEDIKFLAQRMFDAFCKKFGKEKYLAKCTIQLMFSYPWPGNVREMENVIQRLVIHGGTTIYAPAAIRLYDEFQPYADGIKMRKSHRLYDDQAIATAEAERIRSALNNHRLMRDAALELGIALRTLQDKIKKLGIVTARTKKMLRYQALEEKHIRDALDKTNSQKAAAILLGLPLRTFEEKLKSLGIKTKRQPRRPPIKIEDAKLAVEEAANAPAQNPEPIRIFELDTPEQRNLLIRLFQQNDWSQKRVAEILGISLKGKANGLRGLIIKHKLINIAPEGIWFGEYYK